MSVVFEFMRLSAELPWFSTAWALIGGLAATIINHRFSLRRDRRKEFNDIAAPIRATLLTEKSHLTPNCPGISRIDIDKLQNRLPRGSRDRFRECLAAYQRAKSDTRSDEIGQPFYRDPNAVAAAIDALLRFTAPR